MSEQLLGKHTVKLDEQGTLTLDGSGTQVTLAREEAYKLLVWLSGQRATLSGLLQEDTQQQHSVEKQLEIRLYQDDLNHLDEIKEAIPGLHERRPAIKVLDARLETVTERALRLLHELRLEYIVHPSLEENDSFAQG
ncbi:MAG: hypothetical protein NVS4B7_20640 [Ktedonobacteraceae bacterium]